MKYLFIQRDGLAWHGIMSISAMLKLQDHTVDLILTDELRRPMDYIKKFNPDYVLFPVITGEDKWVQSLADEIKQELRKVKTVFGGAHATFYPDTLSADYIIRGEADYLNLWDNEGVHLYEPISDITLLPESDRSIYYSKYPHLAKASSKQFLTARGCPFSCSFCSGHVYHKMFPNAPLIRRRLPEQVIQEIINVREKWGLKSVSFTDDVFTLDKKWLSTFLELYKKEVKLPFICNTRFDIINEDFINLLKDSGCYGLEMGVESGSYRIRKQVLNKGDGTNITILKAGQLIKSYGLMLKTYNIIGIPTETLEEAFETVELNSKLKADQTSCSFMTPFKGYDIAKYYPKNVELTDSIYRPMKIIPKEIINLQTFFFISTKYPKLQPLIKQLIKLPPNKLYRLIAMFVYGLFMARVHKLTLSDIWRYRKINPFRI